MGENGGTDVARPSQSLIGIPIDTAISGASSAGRTPVAQTAGVASAVLPAAGYPASNRRSDSGSTIRRHSSAVDGQATALALLVQGNPGGQVNRMQGTRSVDRAPAATFSGQCRPDRGLLSAPKNPRSITGRLTAATRSTKRQPCGRLTRPAQPTDSEKTCLLQCVQN